MRTGSWGGPHDLFDDPAFDQTREEARRHAIEKEGLMETDPVCGMDVDVTEAEHTLVEAAG